MRITILTPEFSASGGGIGTFYRHLCPVLRQNGIDLRIIEGSAFHAENKRSRKDVDDCPVETLELGRLTDWWRRFSHLAGVPVLRRHLAAAWAMWEQAEFGVEADVVEASDWGFLFVPAVIEASRPLITQCHGSVGQVAAHDLLSGDETQNVVARLLERAVLSCAREIQTYSAGNAEFWRAETGSHVSLIRPSWQALQTDASGATSDRGLVVGRLQRWKGPQIVCAALRRLGGKAPTVEWIGRDMPWGARSETSAAFLAREYPTIFGKHLVSSPQVSPAEIATRQARAAFNLVPSVWDVFNFTAIEAMASGRPTIVSCGAGASELIEDGVNGFLFPAGDAVALADVISRVIGLSPSQAATIGRNGVETVRCEFNPVKIANQRISAYRDAIANFASERPGPVDGWLGDICRPSEAISDQTAFLENYPLRTLASHVASRAARRFLRR